MSTPEEIKKIAREYAEHICPLSGYTSLDEREKRMLGYISSAKSVLEWLSKDYCIVPKSKLREWQGIVEDALKADHVITEPAFRFMWERLFNEEKI